MYRKYHTHLELNVLLPESADLLLKLLDLFDRLLHAGVIRGCATGLKRVEENALETLLCVARWQGMSNPAPGEKS